MPITPTESNESLACEYDLKFAEFTVFRDERLDAAPFDGATKEEKKMRNWATWCKEAAVSWRFCRLCSWPLGEIEEPNPDSRCSACRDMEATLFQRSYWTNL
jgi:hypothetical protein